MYDFKVNAKITEKEGVSKDTSSFLFFILNYLCRLLSGRDFSIAHDQLQYILPQTSQNKAFYAIK